jgi:hypothetical protein
LRPISTGTSALISGAAGSQGWAGSTTPSTTGAKPVRSNPAPGCFFSAS